MFRNKMTNKQKTIDGAITVVVLLAILFGLNYFWNHKTSDDKDVKKVEYGVRSDAPVGTLIEGFPTELAVDKATIDASYTIPYADEYTKGTTRQYTVEQMSDKTAAE
jgi:hypothetical protein